MSDHLLKRVVPAYAKGKVNLPLIYKTESLTNVAVLIPNLNIWYGYSIYNPNSYDVFFKIFDHDDVPIVGTTLPTLTFQVPATGSIVLLGTDILYGLSYEFFYMTVTTGYLGNNAVAPAINVLAQIWYL